MVTIVDAIVVARTSPNHTLNSPSSLHLNCNFMTVNLTHQFVQATSQTLI